MTVVNHHAGMFELALGLLARERTFVTTLHQLSRLLVFALASLSMLTLAVSAAQAHDQLVSSTPAANESVTAAPIAVVLEFNNDILDTGSVILVTNVNGESVTNGAITVADRTATQALISDLPNGQYRVVWRVVSADGHPIEDAYQFAVGEPLGPFEPTTAPTPIPTPEETAAAEPDSSVTVTATAAEPEQGDSALLRIGVIALIGAGIGVGVYAVIALRKKRMNTAPAPPTKD